MLLLVPEPTEAEPPPADAVLETLRLRIPAVAAAVPRWANKPGREVVEEDCDWEEPLAIAERVQRQAEKEVTTWEGEEEYNGNIEVRG